MGITIDQEHAIDVLGDAVAWAESSRPVPSEWVERARRIDQYQPDLHRRAGNGAARKGR